MDSTRGQVGGLYPYLGGGLDAYNGGGLDLYNGGGLDTSPGGVLYDGPSENPYMSCIPPIHVFIPELRARGYHAEADLLSQAHGIKA